jgi:putative ABC transport system permease protein
LTELLARLLGRLPIGWLQLTHNKGRLAAALAGVSFAALLILMQLGFLGALVATIRVPYDRMRADLLISSTDANTLTDGSPLPRRRMFEALSVPGVASATPLFLGKADWRQPDGTIRTLDVFGVDPAAETFRDPRLNARRADLTRSDIALVDARTRNAPPGLFAEIAAGQPFIFELRGRRLTVVDSFEMGGGFSADGYLVVSDQTFLRLFPQRAAGAPNHIVVTLAPGADPANTAHRLRAVLPAYDSMVRTVEEAAARDQAFQTTQRPVGLVFGFGVVIGALVGVIIVYQVLSTDVADHLKEYATLKAIGYGQRFFLGIVFEEALILALLGFVPGLLVSLGLYAVISSATGLPLVMNFGRVLGVFVAIVGLCGLSGAVATRRLARANPADLF